MSSISSSKNFSNSLGLRSRLPEDSLTSSSTLTLDSLQNNTERSTNKTHTASKLRSVLFTTAVCGIVCGICAVTYGGANNHSANTDINSVINATNDLSNSSGLRAVMQVENHSDSVAVPVLPDDLHSSEVAELEDALREWEDEHESASLSSDEVERQMRELEKLSESELDARLDLPEVELPEFQRVAVEAAKKSREELEEVIAEVNVHLDKTRKETAEMNAILFGTSDADNSDELPGETPSASPEVSTSPLDASTQAILNEAWSKPMRLGPVEAELKYEMEERLARENGLRKTTHADETQQWLDEMSANLDVVIERNKNLIADNQAEVNEHADDIEKLAQEHEDAIDAAFSSESSQTDTSDVEFLPLTKALHQRMFLNTKHKEIVDRLMTPSQRARYEQLLKNNAEQLLKNVEEESSAHSTSNDRYFGEWEMFPTAQELDAARLERINRECGLYLAAKDNDSRNLHFNELTRLLNESPEKDAVFPAQTLYGYTRDTVHWSAHKARKGAGYIWSFVPSFRREQ